MEKAYDPAIRVLVFPVRLRGPSVQMLAWLLVFYTCLPAIHTTAKDVKAGGGQFNGDQVRIRVGCSPSRMRIAVDKPDSVKAVYLQHLKGYPDKGCQPSISPGGMLFDLDLSDVFRCMVTKVFDRITERTLYYHYIVVERTQGPKQVVQVKCDSSSGANRTEETVSLVKRAAAPQFPTDFQEPDYDIEITSEITARAPVPELTIGVKQAGFLIGDELTVQPGTPLDMEIYLDDASKDVYGVMVSAMEVTDTKTQSEVLVLNGCTVDPFLFENFLTEDGNFLTARFKAFKFPESDFVLFKGVVNVCLDTCTGVECANDQIGFGKRKRRSVATRHPDKAQKVYEISASTIIKVASIPERSAEVIEEQVDSRLLRSPAAVARRADDFDPNDDHRVDFDQVAEEQQAFLAEKAKDEPTTLSGTSHHGARASSSRLPEVEFLTQNFIDFEPSQQSSHRISRSSASRNFSPCIVSATSFLVVCSTLLYTQDSK